MPPNTSLPKSWPPDIPYLTSPILSKNLTPAQKTALQVRCPEQPLLSSLPHNTPRGPCSLVKITPITSPAHPANGQSGLFATRDLKPGTFILQYLGEIHGASDDEGVGKGRGAEHEKSDYDLSLDRELGIAIDADRMGNEARFINDYRGVADRPNAEFKEIWVPDGRGGGIRGMGVWVLGGKGRERGVRKGEEILVSYGRGFWGARKEVTTTEEDEIGV